MIFFVFFSFYETKSSKVTIRGEIRNLMTSIHFLMKTDSHQVDISSELFQSLIYLGKKKKKRCVRIRGWNGCHPQLYCWGKAKYGRFTYFCTVIRLVIGFYSSGPIGFEEEIDDESKTFQVQTLPSVSIRLENWDTWRWKGFGCMASYLGMANYPCTKVFFKNLNFAQVRQKQAWKSYYFWRGVTENPRFIITTVDQETCVCLVK